MPPDRQGGRPSDISFASPSGDRSESEPFYAKTGRIFV